MKKTLLFIFASILTVSVAGQIDSTKARARELLEITGSANLGIQMMNQMISSFKTQAPGVPNKFWDEFMKEIDPNDILELIIPIYVKHFSISDLEQLIQFYKTPLGQKFISKLPIISQDSYTVGQEWGQKLGVKVAEKLIEGGYLKDK